MPIVFKSKNTVNALSPTPYRDEFELQQLIAENPKLISSDVDMEVAYVIKELPLPDSGKWDLVLLDSSGLPIIVEVKLARNNESRRTVVAQVFDYVSSLARLTVDELNERTKGSLEQVVANLSNEDDNRLKTIWTQCGRNLRAGNIQVVVAVDEAGEDLIRMLEFINQHSDLDVRLVNIKKYQIHEEEQIIVPALIVYGGERQVVKTSKDGAVSAKFEEVLTKAEEMLPNQVVLDGNGRFFRFVKCPHWPKGLHYEFLYHKETNVVTVELHLESKELLILEPVLKGFIIKLSKRYQERLIMTLSG